ncbi:serine/threonine-protein kinase [Candidatus Uabimicrobium amorphum]|uniref:non-specific serine/threonine protein kinase n=1 Tax=Uabimicrobium amorphum TaxID=2596890 RepID=A0A5S9F1Q4_UABAM|nr:serine/threonine-protein kinase [Candidatus Uabimicrobium amorphum]BBM82652.1 protein kinase [Candidatus Uabimicrobium amorphum]
MVTAQDKVFIEKILQMNYVTREQIQECLTLKKIDASKSMADILLEKRYLTQQQVVALMSQTTTSNNIHFSTGLFNSKILSGNTLFERYQVITELGRGGMGIVYKARDLHLQRTVALKMLLESNTDEVAVKRFLREAQTCAQLKHENLIELYDSNVEHGRYFFTMEYIEGQTLKSYAAENRLSTTQITEIMLKMCAGIAYAHTKGVIHRDLKPQNIMIKKNGVVKIMDFGLARSAENTKLSKSGAIVGTLVYMPPEQLSGKKRELDLRSDVYSLGAILYELLTGRPPFQGSYFNLLNYVLNHKPVPPSEVKPYVSKNLETICLKAMEKDKHDRYTSVEKMMRDLKRALAGEKISQKRSWKNMKLSQVLTMVIVATCFFLIGWTSTVNQVDYEQQQKDSRHVQNSKSPATIPKNLWRSCWKKSYFDFTESVWMNLSSSDQKKYSNHYQKWYAQQHNINRHKTFTISENEVTMCLIPPGKFFMGQKGDENADNAQHRVTISQPFYVLKNKLDRKTLAKLLQMSPPKFFGLSWQDAVDYCEMLGWVLPSEAQWEYMFRAGVVEEKFLTKDNTWGVENFDHIGEWCFDRADVALYRNKNCVRTPNTYVDDNVDPLCKEGQYNIFRRFGVKRYTSSADRVDVRPILPVVTSTAPLPNVSTKEVVIGRLSQQSGTQNLIGLDKIGLAPRSLGWNPKHNRFIIADAGGKFAAQFILKKVPAKVFICYKGLVSASPIPGLVNVEMNNHILENRSTWPNTEYLKKTWCIDKSMLREGLNVFSIYYAGNSAHVWFDYIEIATREK